MVGIILIEISFTVESDIQGSSSNSSLEMEETASSQADIIVNKYRVKDGVLQYKKWNETQGAWLKSEWMEVKEAKMH